MDNNKNTENQIKQLEKEVANLKKMVLQLNQRLIVAEKTNRRLVLAAERANNQLNAINSKLNRG